MSRSSRFLIGVRVLDACQALEWTPTRIRPRRRRLIQPRLHRLHEGRHRRAIGALHPSRRHHAREQLVDDLLGGHGVVGRARGIEAREREPAGLPAIAVASDAVGLEQSGIGSGGARQLVAPRSRMARAAGVAGLVRRTVAAPCPARATGSQPRTTTRPMRIRVSFFIPRSSWDKAHAAQGGRCASEEYSESIWGLSLNVGGTEGATEPISTSP